MMIRGASAHLAGAVQGEVLTAEYLGSDMQAPLICLQLLTVLVLLGVTFSSDTLKLRVVHV